MKIIELGKGTIKIEPCFVSVDDRRQALLFEEVSKPHEIGSLTDDKPGLYIPNENDTLLILGSIESAEVLINQINMCIELMKESSLI